jgi:hypothetical protein
MRNLESTMKKLAAVLPAAVVAALVGCAAEIGDIDRTEPNLFPKSWFTGEWYVRPTVIRTQFNQGQLFEGLEGTMEKIRWEVQENHLIGWRSYEFIPNSEANPGSHTPIAIFRIVGHVDKRREYNPANGAETNVIVENTSDRPWWERDYIRVNWSENIAPDLDIAGWVMEVSSASLEMTQTADPYEPAQNRITGDYMDIVTRVQMRPDWDSAWDYSLLEVSEADIRWSFRKVSDTTAYDPLLYPDFMPVKVRYRYAQRVGGTYVPCNPGMNRPQCVLYAGAPSSGDSASCASASTTPTPGWADHATYLCHPDTALTDDCFCNPEKVNLWVDSYGNLCDSRLEGIIDPEDCMQVTYPVFERFGYFRTLRVPYDWEREFTFDSRIYLANRWNIWKKSRNEDGSLIPYTDREPNPVVYYTNPEFPDDLLPAAVEVAKNWTRPFNETTALLKGIPVADVPDMFVLRQNSCNINNVRTFAREHDLDHVLAEAMGGPDALALGNLSRACTALEVATRDWTDADRFEWQRMGDLRYSFMHWVHTPQQAGPLGYGPSAADPETGEIINANAYIYGAAVDTYANFAADMVQLLNGEVPPAEFSDGDNVVDEISHGRALVNQGLSKRSTRQLMQRVADMDQADPGSYLTRLPSRAEMNRADARSALALADQNGRLKMMEEFARGNLVTEDMLRAFAGPDLYQPGQRPSDEALLKANPTTWGRWPDPVNRMGADSTAHFHDHGATTGALDSEARRERFFAEHSIEYGHMLVEPAIYGLALSLKGKTRDEVVRHVRREVYKGVQIHEVGHTIGLRHNFSGSSDALNFHKEFWTEPELTEDPASKKWDYAYSSIMDYHQRFNSDWAGIGPYDAAAVRFGYGQLLETFDESQGRFFPDSYFDFALSVMDYKDIPRILGGGNVDQEFENAYYKALAGETDVVALPPSVTPSIENVYRRKQVPFGDVYADYLRNVFGHYTDAPGGGRQYVSASLLLPAHKVVPYQFCSDLYAWGGNLMCNRYDMGANVQEVVQNAAQMYESYYLFNNFRRDRYQFLGGPGYFSVGGYLNRLYSRTFQPMLNSFRYFYYYRRSSYMMFPLVVDWAAAAFNGLNFFGNVLQKPEPGRHCLQQGTTYVPMLEAPGTCDAPIDIPLGEGRFFGTRWTDEYYYKADRIGSYWDKWLAVMALTDSQFFLVRNYSSLFDRGAWSITYYRVFEKELAGLFLALAEGNMAGLSAGVKQDPLTGQYQVVPRPLVGGEAAGATDLKRVKAAMAWPMQKEAVFLGMLGFTSTVDRKMDFARRMRVTYEGSAEDPLYQGFTDDEIARFTDPFSHLTYRAAPVGTQAGVPDPESPGFVLVKRTADLHDQAWLPARGALDQAEVAVEEARAINNPEALTAALAARDQALAAFNEVDRRLRDRVDLLEYVRIMGHYLHLYMD